MDWNATLLDPAYVIFGREMVLSTAVSFTAIDETKGVEVMERRGREEHGILVVRPCAIIRMAELTAAGLTRGDLRNQSCTLNGKSWVIKHSMPRPTPHGESDGELLLILSEA